MNRFVLANSNLCIGCDTCMAACLATHKDAGLQPMPRLTIARGKTLSRVMTCLHCDNAPCAKACPTGALVMSGKGVVVDEAKCDGCQQCAPACPFDLISFAAHEQAGDVDAQAAGEKMIAVKCDLCDFNGHDPACVQVCPTKALTVIDPKSLRRSGNEKRKLAAQSMPLVIDSLTK